ncbi:carbohydrate kinase, YjeF related protein [Pseudofrankia inefficax]|uniref:ADP-dependent (S)-NAD(P)H-hydrate dehydratase n=2 Tax=Pseudofrankia inefficax (strain DSM 45817 / CECT 9037 / DDB 130130 / EuI1c) TaxID=298654 RepID=E3J369_PSEI1|nr:carbohydrate kinase, YjeF related protein [Pseudofrankia inefficax]
MQRAVSGLLSHAVGFLGGRAYGRRVVVLAGGGDNGGDALWVGARLAARGARVDVLAPGRTHPEATAALLAAGGRRHHVVAPGEVSTATDDSAARPLPDDRVSALLAGADLVLDGLLGIGGRGGLRAAHARLAELAPAARTIAVDVPSGVDADTGSVVGPAVRAARTVTFGTYKRGLLLGAGATHVGQLALVEIGLDLPEPDLTALDDDDVAALLPVPGPTDSKYTRGVLGLVGGSDRYPGAVVLATGGALRGGAGYLRVVAESRAAEHVRRAHPEAVVTVIEPGDATAMLAAGRVQAWALGPGIVPGPAARQLVEALVGTDVPLLLDAGGLDPFAEAFAAGFRTGGTEGRLGFTVGFGPGPGGSARGAGRVEPSASRETLARRAAPVLLTPHEGEFTRLTATALGWDPEETGRELATDRLATVRLASGELGVTVLLKGARTLVVDPGGAARVNTTGTPWLGSAGTGDVLTGLAGSLLAAGLGALDAASVAAYLHGRAGELAPRPLAAADLPGLLPAARAGLSAAADAVG